MLQLISPTPDATENTSKMPEESEDNPQGCAHQQQEPPGGALE